jgi:Flp pilus assembly pilin Flp
MNKASSREGTRSLLRDGPAHEEGSCEPYVPLLSNVLLSAIMGPAPCGGMWQDEIMSEHKRTSMPLTRNEEGNTLVTYALVLVLIAIVIIAVYIWVEPVIGDIITQLKGNTP